MKPQTAPASPLDRALLALEKMEAKLAAAERAKAEPIAIVGLGCRFPGGGTDPEAFWRALEAGVDAIREVPEGRWPVHAVPGTPPAARWAGLLDEIDGFDAAFFGVSPREAAALDPQQRLLLEVTWEALEHAGQAPDRLTGTRTGVYVGMMTHDYQHVVTSADWGDIDVYATTGIGPCFAAGRLSYQLGLQGPCIALDTACSSSLVTVHLACQSLRQGETDLALAGGVTILVSPLTMLLVAQTQGLSPDGRCKTFDAQANGYVRSEGCGMVVLKRLSDAQRDGDCIWGLIRGSAVNQDGRSTGLTTPNVLSQQALLREALRSARVQPSQVSYIEAHGTGTSLGDPIEFEALQDVFGQPRADGSPCVLSSVKTNVGHMEAAAGVAGLMKVALAMRHETIPRHLHFETLNPRISLEGTPFVLPLENRPWHAGGAPRIAGVSSFGMSGTNAHIVLEEPPPPAAAAAGVDRPMHVLTLSGRTEEGLADQAARFAAHLAARPEEPLGDVCYTASTGRAHFEHRLAVVAASSEKLRQALDASARGEAPAGVIRAAVDPKAARAPIAFLFTGQGAQHAGMARALFEAQPVFRDALRRCDELLRPLLDRPLLSVLHPEEGAPPLLDETAYTQPALFAVEYALAELWRSWGVEPDAVLGHSVGEIAAACVAGVYSLEDGLKLIAGRGRLMQSLPQDGAMAAVRADPAVVEEAIAPHRAGVSIAAWNGPKSVVISGLRSGVRAACAWLEASGIETKELTVSHAFHSPLMDPILDGLEDLAREIRPSPARVRLISNVSGGPADKDFGTPSYWRRHARQPVRFADGISALRAQGCRIFIEIGPHPTLIALGAAFGSEEGDLWLPSLRKGHPDWRVLLESVARLHVRGFKIDWRGFDQPYARRRLPLPTYPFQRQRCWVSAAPSWSRAARGGSPGGAPAAALELLDQTDVPALAEELSRAGQLSDEERALLPKLLEGLRARHRREADSATIERWLYEVAWQPAPRRDAEAPASRRQESWLIIADRGRVGEALARHLVERGEPCALVRPGQEWRQFGRRSWEVDLTQPEDVDRLVGALYTAGVRRLSRVVDLIGLDAPPPSALSPEALEQAQRDACAPVLHLVQALSKHGRFDAYRLWIVTRGAVAVGPEPEPVSIAAAGLWGLGRVIALELPEAWGGLLDLAAEETTDDAAAVLSEIAGASGEDHIALRGGRRHVARVVRSELPEAEAPPLRPDATYLITGGLGALGLRVARWMVERGARHLVLTSRRGAEDPAAEAAVAGLARAGAQARIRKADVADRPSLARLLEEIEAEMPPLRGVVHSAGVVEDGVLQRLDWGAFTRVLAPKVHGAWNLHELTLGRPLDLFVTFSSATAMLGAPGQASYAAGNAFMDALAHHRRALGLPALSVNWGPWAGAGMAAKLEERLRQRLAGGGLKTIGLDQGLAALERLLAGSAPQVAVLPIEWETWAAKLGKSLPLIRDLLPDAPAKAAAEAATDLLLRVVSSPFAEARELVKAHVAAEVTRVLGLDDPAALDPGRGFAELGMDSLMAVELKNRLQSSVRRSLSSTVIFNHPSVTQLSNLLLDMILDPPAPSSRTMAPPSNRSWSLAPKPSEEDVSKISQLSEDDVASAISERFVTRFRPQS